MPEPEYQGLLKNKKNELLEIVREVGLNPNNFSWVEVGSPSHGRTRPMCIVSVLKYLGSPYFYKFDMQGETYQPERCPGIRLTSEVVNLPYVNWALVVDDFTEWARRVKADSEALDLWAEAQKYQSIFLLPGEVQSEEAPLSFEDAEKIASALEEAEKRIIQKFKPTDEQLQFIQQKRVYLESRAKKGYPRIDWVNLLMATLITIAFTLSLNPEQAILLKDFYVEALRSVVELLV